MTTLTEHSETEQSLLDLNNMGYWEDFQQVQLTRDVGS